MRSTVFRYSVLGAFLLGLGTAVVWQPREASAQKAVILGEEPPPKDPKETGTEKISFPESKDTNRMFEAIRDYLDQKEPKWKLICQVGQQILDGKSDYFYQYIDGENKGRRVSVKDEMNRMIGKFPKEGTEFYNIAYGPFAEPMLKNAKENGYDKAQLAEVSQRYFHTKAGAEATLLLATLNLETGNYPEAAYGFRRLLARPDAEKVMDAKSLFKASVAIRRAGDGKQTDEVAGVWDKFEKKFPRDGLQLGRKAYSIEQLKVELNRPVEYLFGSVGAQFIAGKGGDNTRAALSDAGVPFLGTILSVPVLYNADTPEQQSAAATVKSWIDNAYRQAKTTDKQKAPLLPSMFPVTAPNLIMFRGYDGVYAFYSRDFKDALGNKHTAGDQAWFTPSHWGAAMIQQAGADQSGDTVSPDRPNQENWMGNSWAASMPSVLFENPLAGTLSHDGKRVYFVDDFNIPPPPLASNPNFDPWGGNQQFQDTGRGGKKDYNRLVAVDLETGSLAWSLGEASPGRSEDGPPQNSGQLAEGAIFLGPPVTVNGKLYAMLERDGALLMACFDAYKETPVAPPIAKPGVRAKHRASARQPELLWVQNLGRPNNPVRQDSARRYQGAFLSTADGVMICPTNSGAVVAVDLNARSLLWAHTYASLDRGSDPGMSGGGGFGRRPIRQPGVVSDTQRWRSSGPIFAGGRILLTAYDSPLLQCLEARTGKVLWQENRRADDLYVGGVLNEKVVIVGRNSVRAIKLFGEKDEKTGKEKTGPAWEQELKIALPTGHGVAGKDGLFYLPVVGDPDKTSDTTASVIGVNVATGKVQSTTLYRRKEGAAAPGAAVDPRLALGNLVFHDGMMFSQSATEVAAFELNEVKRRQVDEVIAKNPNDPDGLFSRGELSLEAGKLPAAIEDFKKSESNKPSESTAKKLKQKLYVAYTDSIRLDFNASEKLLEEYKTLCDFNIDKDDINAGRLQEEQIRRKGLYYSLVADGRQKQGRLVDAFDNYRLYAELGEQNKLLPVPEDPNTFALSSVWASGRIDAMMKTTKDPQARKPLEDKVAKEWDEVKTANDLERLRKFVRVFGPYFESGREANYLLAKRLSETNDDTNRREAQSLLLSLIAQADDDKDAPNAARATDALAQLLTSRGLLDDALGLYRRVAERYPDSQVRDGKTGSDLLGELITDKRYLPSLETGRPAPMGRYTAVASAGSSGQRPSSFSLVNDGDVLPFFKRNRVSLEVNDPYGQGAPILKVTDRVTQDEKYKVSGLPPVSFYGTSAMNAANGGLNNQRIAQVSGHMMLLNLNDKVYCYDLSKGAELWKMELIDLTPRPPNPNQSYQFSQEIEPNGDMISTRMLYNNQTGQQTSDWSFRVGRSMVLQPGYATVLTKEAMVTKEPRTGQVLWQRAGVNPKAMVFGDARHVFLAEHTATGSSSRVFRAVDGVQIANVPDFGPLALGASRLHILGRCILLFEYGGKEKPKTMRLYDALEGKDVWTREFPADSVAFETLDSDLCGAVSADGKIEILSSRTGKVLQSLAVDSKKVAEHLKDDKGKFNLSKPLLMADADRFYTFLNRDIKANPNVGFIQTPESQWGASLNRTRFVNGAVYAFDRGTGARAWYMETEFLNQRLLVDRFDELPCLVAANPIWNEDGTPANGGGKINRGNSHKMVAVDKANGAVKDSKELPYGNGWLMGFYYDKTKGTYEIGGSNGQRILIAPEVDKKK